MTRMKRYFYQTTKGDIIFDFVKVIFLTIILVITVYPFLNILAISFNDAADALKGGIHLLPRKFSTASYKEILKNQEFMASIKITIARTIIGTPIALLTTSMAAYVLSRKELFARKWITLLFIFTMYFSGGMVPTYMVIKNLGLIDNFWVFIFPMALEVYNVILVRSYIDSLPDALFESAKMDGANDIFIFFKIIIPLIRPILLTVGLFIAVSHWNSWFDAFLYTSSQELKPMQSILVEILNQFQTGGDSATEQMTRSGQTVTADSIRMAATIVSTIPILIIYPIIQKYFVKGMMLGAVKD